MVRNAVMLSLVFGLALAANLATGPATPGPDAGQLAAAQPLVAPGEMVLAPTVTELEWTDNPEETLHYDGTNSSGIGLTNGGTYRGAARFTPTSQCTVKAVLFYQRDASDNDYVFVLGECDDTTSGPILDSAPYTGSGSLRWKRVNLSAPLVTMAGTDFWACVRVTHDSGAFPLGVDAGPMVRNRGGFIATSASGNRWQQLADLPTPLNYNWNIRAIVEPVPGLAHDVGVSRILAPGTSVGPGAYTPKARVVNFGTTAESNIPVTCWVDSSGTRVYDQTVNFAGPLQPGNRTDVTFTPDWVTGPSGNSYQITMFTGLAADLDRSNDTTCQVTSIMTGQPLMDHDTGYCKLTVSCFGSIGYDNPPADAGSGFCWPKTAASALFYGSFAVGTEPAYVADRHFGQPASGPVNNDLVPVDSLVPVEPPGAGDQHYQGSFSDAGHPSPKGLKVFQNSYQAADPNYDDFVVITYNIENQGAEPVSDLYAGIFADFDLGTSSSNTATSDTARRLTYMRQASTAYPTVGVKILAPQSFANLSAIDHAVYVYPDSCMNDGQKFRFLDGTIVQRNSSRTYDWSVCTSVGPFDLGVGEIYRFAVAFVGGSNEPSFLANADSAQSWYETQVAVVERPGLAQEGRRFNVRPNPFGAGTWVHYLTAVAGDVELTAYDAAGREVERVVFAAHKGAGRYRWLPQNLARGVYFLNIKTPDHESLTKVLRVE